MEHCESVLGCCALLFCELKESGFGWVVNKVVDEVVGCDLRVVDIGCCVGVGVHA